MRLALPLCPCALAAALASLLMMFSTPARAQIACPEGYRPVPTAGGGWTCGGASDPGHVVGPSVDEWNAGVSALSKSIIENGIESARAPPPPLTGWNFTVTDDYCSARFGTPNGAILLEGPRKAAAARRVKTTLAIWSRNVSPAERTARVDVLFVSGPTEGEKATQAVKAMRRAGLQEYFLAVPSNEGMVSAMEDEMTFKISVAGKAVVEISWTGGNEAKAKLGKCFGVL